MQQNNYNVDKKQMLTSDKVLLAISDDITAHIFKIIANSNSHPNGRVLLSKMKITRKQYYRRMESLTKAGLIKRKNGIYYLTSFGKVIHNYQLKIETALSYHWKLEALDSILVFQSSDKAKMPVEEKVNLVDKLIENREIKEIILSVININNNNNNNNGAAVASSSSTDNNYNRRHYFRQQKEQETFIHF